MQLLLPVLLLDDNTAGAGAAAAMMGGSIVSLIISLAIGIFFLWLQAKIFAKAGYSPWLTLLMIIPLVNLIVFIWFAFAEWPVSRGVRS